MTDTVPALGHGYLHGPDVLDAALLLHLAAHGGEVFPAHRAMLAELLDGAAA